MRLLISALFDDSSPIDYIVDQKIVSDNPEDLKVHDADNKALIIWGGEDIASGIYGHRPAFKYTDADSEPSQRDRLEIAMAKKAIDLGIPIIGICRGAQLMCALSGGTLVQHVDNHAGKSHLVVTNTGHRFMTNSVHHQMMNPFKVDHELLAWSATKLSGRYIGNGGEEIAEAHLPDFKESEIVWFPKTKALCIQGHPEYQSASVPFIRETLKLIEKYIFPPR